MSEHIRWGILGPGSIARAFAGDLALVQGAVPRAVASSNLERATSFAREYGFERAYGSYQELVDDPEVDVVYIATPHPYHLPQSLLCLDHGKAVLCEKPVTVNAREFIQIQEKAAANKLFYMEGMWTRFFPVMKQVRTWLQEGRIGEPRMVQADFCFRADKDPSHRIRNLDLAGGCLLDLGIYPLAFITMVLGTEVEQTKASAHIGDTGVDEQTTLLLKYPGGQLAVATAAFRTNTTHEATIWGTEGAINVPAPFSRPSKTILAVGDKQEVFDQPYEGHGFHFEIQHAQDCLRQGITESPVITLAESLKLQQIMDEARRQIGLVYPMD